MPGSTVNRSKAVEEQVWCHKLRLRGFTIREIADLSEAECPTGRKLSVATVHRRVNAELAARPQDSATELREFELSKLDDLERKVREVLEREHVKIVGGQVVMMVDAETEEPIRPVLDDGPVLHAVDRLLKIAERRAKLTGTDAPAQVVTDATVRIELVGVDAEDL